MGDNTKSQKRSFLRAFDTELEWEQVYKDLMGWVFMAVYLRTRILDAPNVSSSF